jgi:integrase/recombinase XerC
MLLINTSIRKNLANNQQVLNVFDNPRKAFSEELLKRFIDFIDVRSNTIVMYKASIKQFFKWINFKGITNPNRKDILEYKDNLSSRLKPSTIANYIIAIKQFFKWTENEGIYANITENIKTPKMDKGYKKDYLTAQQVKTLLDSINKTNLKDLRDYALLLLMITGGLRTIEVSRAKVEDLRVVGKNEVLYIQGKGCNEKTEFIKITNQVGNAIREYLKKAVVKETSPLFVNLSNNSKWNQLTSQSISRIIKRRLRQAGYDNKRLTAHSLRHTAVTLALLSGVSIQEAQSFARHSNINSTQIYAHNMNKMESRSEQLITEAILGKE